MTAPAWIELLDRSTARIGETLATYAEPQPNDTHRGHTDGITLAVYSAQPDVRGGAVEYVVIGAAKRPDWTRRHLGFHARCLTYADALDAGARWLPRAREHCAAVSE